MADSEDVVKLAALSRIAIAPEEIDAFTKEFDTILGYVGLLEKVEFEETDALQLPIQNVFREDTEPHEERLHTEAIINQFPEREGDKLLVKQIISHD